MSSIVSAFDKDFRSKRLGENGHVEYDWSKKTRELISQFYFQLVRTEDTSDLKNKLTFLLKKLTWEDNEEELTALYKIMAQTRDIVNGKGDYENTWMQMLVWYEYYPDLTYNAFVHCVDFTHKCLNGHQYGSFKDIKYFLAYVKENTELGEAHPLVNYILTNIAMKWLKRDENLLNQGKPVSLCGRWIPREKSSKRFNWIFNKLARIMYKDFGAEPPNGWKNHSQMKKAQLKQKIHLKKLLVKLSGNNGGSDTAQVKMSQGRWSELDFNMVTSITLRKQKNAICNKTNLGLQRSNLIDRKKCAQNYNTHIKKCMSGDEKAKIHGKRLNVGELAKDGYNYDSSTDENNVIRNTINLQWESHGENNKGLENMCIIPMCDTSGSMEVDDGLPLNNAIGLTIRISEICHPAFRHRALTFDRIPKWVQFNENEDFVDKAKKLKKSAWGCNTDFFLACDKMIQSLVENNVNPSEVKNLVLAVFSDMQFDSSSHNGNIFDSAHEKLVDMFAEAGLKTTYKTPYDPPHILFWNLRKTDGFPATTFTKNVSFLSGYNSTLLNIFCSEGISAIRQATPYSLIQKSLDISRYYPMDENISDYLSMV